MWKKLDFFLWFSYYPATRVPTSLYKDIKGKNEDIKEVSVAIHYRKVTVLLFYFLSFLIFTSVSSMFLFSSIHPSTDQFQTRTGPRCKGRRWKCKTRGRNRHKHASCCLFLTFICWPIYPSIHPSISVFMFLVILLSMYEFLTFRQKQAQDAKAADENVKPETKANVRREWTNATRTPSAHVYSRAFIDILCLPATLSSLYVA